MGALGPGVSVMGRNHRLLAGLLAAAMILSVATPVALAAESPEITVEQHEQTYTVSVFYNETAVNGSEATVSPTDSNASYEGTSGVTDENGTVTFDLPENETEVNISATYNGSTYQSTKTLNAAGEGGSAEAFGLELVKKLTNFGIESNTPFGQQVSDWVVEHNPGAEHRSDNANAGGNGEGPPEHAGPPESADTDDADDAEDDEGEDDDGDEENEDDDEDDST